MKKFMDENFLLETETAQKLYHEHAANMPIFDYHCHIPPQQIAEDKKFKNLRVFNGVVSVVLLLEGVLMLILSNDMVPAADCVERLLPHLDDQSVFAATTRQLS